MSKKSADTWTLKWKQRLRPTQFPGVWERQLGGHFVRARATDPATARMVEIKKVLPEADAITALNWLEAERKRIRSGFDRVPQPSERFADYAMKLYDEKCKPGGGRTQKPIKSAKGRQNWRSTLQHLIGGTAGTTGKKVAGFGEIFIAKLVRTHILAWRGGICELIAAGDYSPSTANGWLRDLKIIMKDAKRELRLPHLATEDIEPFDTSEHATYTEEEPNTLAPIRVAEFLATMRELYPQHYAMVFLGLLTGLRPSSLRPLRRRGPTPDVLWEKGRILVRRSQTVGDEVMNTTKQKRHYSIDLPPSAMAVLRWHIDTQLVTPEQRGSELLFPSITGGFRSVTVLNKPFEHVSAVIGLGYRFTQRGMRRAFNDLARLAKVEAIVTRSISGHLTEEMQTHYSTVTDDEQRDGLAKVIRLFGGAPSGAPESSSGAPDDSDEESASAT
jgi:integrase